jgi:hypothetical protein
MSLVYAQQSCGAASRIVVQCSIGPSRHDIMDIKKLKQAEADFLARYPDGFADPGLAQIRKRHNVDRLADFAKENVTRTSADRPHAFLETLLTIVSRSSMVSRFEKPPFRQMIESLDSEDRKRLADAFDRRLFGRNKREGFDEIVDFLSQYKLARWSLVSVVPFYHAPTREAFVKPTTAKKIVSVLDVADLTYQARPTWAFYDGYRKLIKQIKDQVDPRLAPNNAAATGFLMATL